MQEHPSKDISGSKNNILKGKKIVLCVTGSVAAVKSVEIARKLMRIGADIYPVMSPASIKIIHPDLLNWATGNAVVTELTGAIEHVALAGNVGNKADLVLIAPATANTIGKIAAGIDDTTVTTVVSTSLGEGIPLIIVPAMHQSIYNHPIVKENIVKLQKIGIEILAPVIEEGKAKIPTTDKIIDSVLLKLSPDKKMEGLSVMITAGPTIEYIDPVRVITNRSSGKMGMEIAKAATHKGADVTVIYGNGKVDMPFGPTVICVETSHQMYEEVTNILKNNTPDILIAAAAVSDWTVKDKSETKISTYKKEKYTLEMIPTVKIIDQVKKIVPDIFLVVFRAVTSKTDKQIIEDAYERLKRANADLIVSNDITRFGAGFGGDTNEVFIIDRNKKVLHVPLSSKADIAKIILDEVIKRKRKK